MIVPLFKLLALNDRNSFLRQIQEGVELRNINVSPRRKRRSSLHQSLNRVADNMIYIDEETTDDSERNGRALEHFFQIFCLQHCYSVKIQFFFFPLRVLI